MALDIPTGWCQVTLNWSGPTITGHAATVLAFDITTLDSFNDLGDLIETSFNDNLKPHIHEAWTLESARIVDNSFALDVGYNIPGDKSGDLVPPNTALLMRKGTAHRGKKYQGRNYWPGFLTDSDVTDSGTITAFYLNTYSDAIIAFFTDLSTAGAYLCLLHNDPDTPPTAVNSVTVENRVATQRRRLR